MTRATLVIGGTRNLGPELVARLLERGDRVSVLNRGQTPDDLPEAVERLRADRSDERALAAALGGRSFDLVVDTTLYTGTDAEAVARVLEARAGRYVFWSTGQVYLVRTGLGPPFKEGDYDGPVMAEPAASAKGDRDNWRYGVDKRAAEDALRRAFEARAFPYVSLRMPMINSARDHYQRLAAYVCRILDGGPILIPDDQDSLRCRHVFGGDVVTASLEAADAKPGSCLNISQDQTLTLEQMLEPVARQLGKPLQLVKRPRRQLESAGLLPDCSPWSGRWMSQLDATLARTALGLKFTAPAEYLPALVEAARAEGAQRGSCWSIRSLNSLSARFSSSASRT